MRETPNWGLRQENPEIWGQTQVVIPSYASRMRRHLANLILATSIRAHGALEARSASHHLWGMALILLVALQVALRAVTYLFRRRP